MRSLSARTFFNRGYTLIEMVVVLAVIGVMAVLGVYALRQNDEAEKLNKAYLELRSNLRAAQNRAQSGVLWNADTINQVASFSGQNSYTTGNNTITLPAGVSVNIYNSAGSIPTPSPGYMYSLYFYNSLKTVFTGTCPSFMCQVNITPTPAILANHGLGLPLTGYLEIVLSNQTGQKIIRVYYNDKYIIKVE